MSNEQRAHDLAIAVLYRIDLVDNDMDAVPIDFYKKYLELYKTALHSFNRDYPNGL